MKRLISSITLICLGLFSAGCVRTHVFEKERVDQEITGNRGVIMGDVPPAPMPGTPPKRTVIGVDIEVPSFGLGRGESTAPAKKEEAAPDMDLWGNKGYIGSREPVPEDSYPYRAESARKESVIEKPVYKAQPKKAASEYLVDYTVKKGDTLSSIAARPEIYGDAGKWKRIFQANKDSLRDSSHIYPGQVLKIPMGGEEEGRRGSRVK